MVSSRITVSAWLSPSSIPACKNCINDEYKEIINVGKKLESLTKSVKDLKTKNDKLEGEIISITHGVDHWRSRVNNMKDKVLDEYKKYIYVENDLAEIKIEQGAIECKDSAMKEHQKFRDNLQMNFL